MAQLNNISVANGHNMIKYPLPSTFETPVKIQSMTNLWSCESHIIIIILSCDDDDQHTQDEVD